MQKKKTVNMVRYLKGQILLIAFVITDLACQKPPSLGTAADNLSAIEPPPMGANTYNDELKRELLLLDDILDGKIEENRLKRLKTALLSTDPKDLPKDAGSDDAHIVKIFLAMPELIHAGKVDNYERRFFKTKFYSVNRRFVEASMEASQLLQIKDDPRIRKLRALALFFLGNPDKAVHDLQISSQGDLEKTEDGLEALYLIGVIIYESNDLDKVRLKTGIDAWRRYLSLAETDEAMKRELEASVKELETRLAGGQIKPAVNQFDPFSPRETYSAAKNAVLRSFQKEEMELALKLIEQTPDMMEDVDIATIKARILFKTGRIIEAAELFATITKEHATYAPGHHYRGMSFMLQNQPKAAIESWKKTLEVDEAYGNAHGLKQRIAVAESIAGPEKIETH